MDGIGELSTKLWRGDLNEEWLLWLAFLRFDELVFSEFVSTSSSFV
jgi:hypothetical protein